MSYTRMSAEESITALHEEFNVEIGDTIFHNKTNCPAGAYYCGDFKVFKVCHIIRGNYRPFLFISDVTNQDHGYSGSMEHGLFHFFVGANFLVGKPL